jgi:protein SPIRAL1 and related proteins
MSRGGSASGGQSSLGYLFGSDEPPKPAVAPAASAPPVEKPSAAKTDATKQVVAGVTSQTNNYHRADGQNTCNFLMSPGTPLSPPLILFLPHSSYFSPTSFSNPNRCRRDTTAIDDLPPRPGTSPSLLGHILRRRPAFSTRYLTAAPLPLIASMSCIVADFTRRIPLYLIAIRISLAPST